MVMKQFKRVLGVSKSESIVDRQFPKLTTIYMSQNFYVVPDRDLFTLDETNDLIIVKQLDKKGNATLAYCFDVANVVGVEHLSVKSRY